MPLKLPKLEREKLLKMTNAPATSTGFRLSERFVEQFADREFREIYVADQVRSRMAMLIRSLRDQRGWSQKQLGDRMQKPQSVVSRIEDPEYGKLSVQTLLEVAAAFELPLFIDMLEWEDWFSKMQDFSDARFVRRPFNADYLKSLPSSLERQQSSALLSQIKHHSPGSSALADVRTDTRNSIVNNSQPSWSGLRQSPRQSSGFNAQH